MDLEQLHQRKPARKIADIPPNVCEALNAGLIPTKNLTEWLVVDRLQLFQAITKAKALKPIALNAEDWEDAVREQSALKQSQAIGKYLAQQLKVGDDRWKHFADHPSDIVREWAALVIGHAEELSFPKKLAWIKPFADDDNAGLREIAWMSLRANVASDPERAINGLVPWTGSRRERLRRFASEITRPCGVWTSHISLLKLQPEMGIALLESLQADDSRYVQDSVGNWLNDASKSRPEWVRSVADAWLKNSNEPSTKYIVKRALRTLRKEN